MICRFGRVLDFSVLMLAEKKQGQNIISNDLSYILHVAI